ncbi:MAG: methylmalonyl-CoA epimerase [Synergistaceae bacterium]|jgi:methylmalonyl-CoA epimerase|nr:methylmalonyl-CoA epimerase [Synergistaceae bacterium]
MKTLRIDHIGMAVKSIKKSLNFWENTLNIQCQGIEEVVDQKVKTAFLPLDNCEVELLEGTSSESPVSKFIERRGEGIHHISLEVEDLESALAELKGREVKLIDESPRYGAGGTKIAFIHPSATGGVLLELMERE